MTSQRVKFAWAAVAVIALLAVLVVAVGFALPERHRAVVRAHYAQPVEAVHHAIIDVAAAPTWRSGVDSVHILSQQPLTWREYTDWGALTMTIAESSASRTVSRIVDTGEGFGGTWTFEIEADAGGTTLTIAEDGEVYNPIFRVMSKFVFGHYTGLEAYAADLGRKFGEEVQVEPVGSTPGPGAAVPASTAELPL